MTARRVRRYIARLRDEIAQGREEAALSVGP
jgi:hypothetical protein